MSDEGFEFESEGGSFEVTPSRKGNGGVGRGISAESYGSQGFGSGEGFAYEDEDLRLESDPNTKNLYSRGRPWETLDPEALKKRQANVTEETVELIGVEPDVAQFLLRSYHWNGNELSEDWFADACAVLKRFNLPQYIAEGAPESMNSPNSGVFFCPITADEVPYSQTAALPCGHRFSDGCWEGYLKCAVEDGSEIALAKRCPMPKCGDLVRTCLWERYLKNASPKEWGRFEEFVRRSYVEMGDPQKIRWCPAPGCTNAVELHSGATDVACACGFRFCMSCGDEAHVPVPCDILDKWNKKNQSEADNVTWILVNTKNCPKCKNPIEKNMGCMHMTCRCRHEFCWICLGDWKNHGDYYSCNVFQKKAKEDPTLAAEEAQRVKAKEMLDRYTHHFERYQAHNHGQKIAQEKTLAECETKTAILRDVLGDLHDFEFLLMAVRQIIECRRMLKWSYAFLYFAKFTPEKKALFEFHQGQLEKYLDILQETAEKTDLNQLVGEGSTSYQPFFDYKSKLSNQTRVVQDFFSKMGDAFLSEFAFFEEEEEETSEKASGSSASGAASSGAAAKAAPKAKSATAKAKVSTRR
eukprot:GDKI01045716.1.p1 GENE.GDKI01045716.1~~GDKI01045716.1.p1  ORF type:complete len:582 (+),score=151.28 GDKI01045716.1:77-1822(+)